MRAAERSSRNPSLRRLLSLVLLLWAAPSLGAVEELRVRVKGLACPFCVFGIEKELKKLPGVASVETTIRTGVVRITMSPEASLELGRLDEAVKRSGFSLDFVEATVTGRLGEHEGRPVLRADSSGQTFLLVEDGREGTFRALTEETHQEMKAASEEGSRSLRVSGRVHGHASSPPALAVESFEVAE